MNKKNTLHNDVLIFTSINSARCYQCGKCTASCPVAEEMDFSSSTLMRMLQIEEEEIDKKLLRSQSIWLCISCKMCLTRCPMKIDISKIIDYLRQRSLKEHLQNQEANSNIIPFYRIFLYIIKYTGQLYEFGLIMLYKLRTLHLIQDLNLSFYIFLKRKLPLFPRVIKKTNIADFF